MTLDLVILHCGYNAFVVIWSALYEAMDDDSVDGLPADKCGLF